MTSLVAARVWAVRYNQFHDQLVLTSSSDWRVLLTSVASLSSEPYGHLLEEEGDPATPARYRACVAALATIIG